MTMMRVGTDGYNNRVTADAKPIRMSISRSVFHSLMNKTARYLNCCTRVSGSPLKQQSVKHFLPLRLLGAKSMTRPQSRCSLCHHLVLKKNQQSGMLVHFDRDDGNDSECILDSSLNFSNSLEMDLVFFLQCSELLEGEVRMETLTRST